MVPKGSGGNGTIYVNSRMPRTPLFKSSCFAYHVYSRSNNREWFYISLNQNWEILTRQLARAAEKYGAEIHSFVLMSNHFHLILSTPNKNLDYIMRYFISESTREIQKRTGRINHIFGGRYRWSILESNYALAYVFKYVFRNPVRAGTCSNVEDYQYSSLNNYGTALPIVEGFDDYWKLLPRNNKERLQWLNHPTKKEHEILITRGLRRYHFQFTTNSNLQEPLRQLKQNYLSEI